MTTSKPNTKYDAFSRKDKRKKTKSFSFLPENAREIMQSWLLWRLVIVIIIAIASVQGISIYLNLQYLEQSKITELKSIAKTALASHPYNSGEIDPDYINNLIENSPIQGISLYQKSTTSGYIATRTYGTPIKLTPPSNVNENTSWFNPEKTTLQFFYRPQYIEKSRLIGVSMNATVIQNFLFNYSFIATINAIILTLVITLVMILSISNWLLEPILFLRRNLLEASKNPEKPVLPESPYNPNDEIGSAIQIAQDLIKKNSFSLQQTKSSAEDKIYKLAYFDSLTTLPNRAFFLQQIERAIRPVGGAEQSSFYVIAVDLDNFKDVNDSMGHNVGDAILRGVGKRLKAGLPTGTIVSRTGEDEFAIMLEIKADLDSTEKVVKDILNIVRNEPFKVFNEDVQIRASAGVTSFPKDSDDAETLVKHADIALNKAKEEGRNGFKEYSEDFEKAIQARFNTLRDLRDAMEQDQLVLFYQPQLDLKTGRIIGAEALIRWWKPDDSPQGGYFVSPGEFIPIAEQTGLIVPMGEWIIRQACADAKSWNEDHGLNMRVAINISGAQFEQSDITAFTKQTLDELALLPSKVELEVTESVFMDDISQTIKTLENLHDLGVELAIDDFGTGYSSLSYLSQFPIDRLKIDQAFVRSALNDKNNASITRTVIALGHALNLKVIAEGVETLEHEEFLLSENCDEVQGFRYSKPLPNERFIEFCKDYNGDLRSFGRM